MKPPLEPAGSRTHLLVNAWRSFVARTWLAAGTGFLALTLVARASSLRAPIGEDAAGYLYVGRTIMDGGTPYVDAAEPKGPATHLMYGLIGLVTGNSAVAVRLALALACALTALVLARFVARSAGTQTGILAGAIFATLGTAIAVDGLDPNTEQFGVLFLVGSVYLASQGSASGAAGAGALAGWAFAMNPGFAAILPLAGFELARATRARGAPGIARAALAFGGGLAFILVGFIAWLGLAGALADMRVQVWDYARTAAAAKLTTSPPATSLTDLRHLLNVPAGSLWVAGAVGAVVSIALSGRTRAIGVSALLWIVVSWLRAKSNHGFEWTHHYYVGMPGIAVGIGAGIGAIVDGVPRRVGFAVVASVLAVPLWSYVVGPQWREWDLPASERANAARFSVAYPMSEVIERETPRNSRIFVAGSEAEIYWLSGRRAPTRWFVNYGLFAAPRFAAERERQLAADPPAAIAVIAPESLVDVSNDVERLVQRLNYRVVWQTDRGTVWVLPRRSDRR